MIRCKTWQAFQDWVHWVSVMYGQVVTDLRNLIVFEPGDKEWAKVEEENAKSRKEST